MHMNNKLKVINEIAWELHLNKSTSGTHVKKNKRRRLFTEKQCKLGKSTRVWMEMECFMERKRVFIIAQQ